MSLRQRLARLRLELRALHGLAIPILIAQLAQSGMGFVDTLMAGRVGADDLAAVALGNSLWMPLFLFMTGVLLATTPKVAQRHGAGSPEAIGPLVRQALWLALVIGLAGAGLLLMAEPVLLRMGVAPELADQTMIYLSGIALGFPAASLYHVLRCYSDGLGRTRPAMIIATLGLALNIPLNQAFIHGAFGLPRLGGAGCGWATAIVMWAMLGAMLFWTRRGPAYHASGLYERMDRPHPARLRELLSVGVPIGIAIFAEASIFSVIALLIGGLGATVVASHQITLNFSSLTFMVPLSLGMAVTVRVGHSLGRGAAREARFAAATGIATAVCYAAVSASVMLLLREPIAQIYTRDPQLIATAAQLLVYAALFQISDGIQVTAAGALRGYQDTRVTMLMTLFAYWGIGLPLGYLLGLTDHLGPASGPAGLWQGLVVALSFAAVMLMARLARQARRHVRRAAPRIA